MTVGVSITHIHIIQMIKQHNEGIDAVRRRHIKVKLVGDVAGLKIIRANRETSGEIWEIGLRLEGNNKCYNQDSYFGKDCPTKRDNIDQSSAAKWSTSDGRDGEMLRRKLLGATNVENVVV